MLEARSITEARLYIEREPCAACGHRGFGHPSKIVEHGERRAVAASGYCPSCGAMRSFELLLGEPRVPPGAWGNAEPSTLIDAGEWITLAEHYASLAPVTRAHLETAIAALDEILKFMPPGTTTLPRAAIFTPRGMEIYRIDPRRLSRERIEVLREAWRELTASLPEQ